MAVLAGRVSAPAGSGRIGSSLVNNRTGYPRSPLPTSAEGSPGHFGPRARHHCPRRVPVATGGSAHSSGRRRTNRGGEHDAAEAATRAMESGAHLDFHIRRSRGVPAGSGAARSITEPDTGGTVSKVSRGEPRSGRSATDSVYLSSSRVAATTSVLRGGPRTRDPRVSPSSPHARQREVPSQGVAPRPAQENESGKPASLHDLRFLLSPEARGQS